MSPECQTTTAIVQGVVDCTLRHCSQHLGLRCTASPAAVQEAGSLTLKGYTAIVGLGGAAGLTVLASFSEALAQHVLATELGPAALQADGVDSDLCEAAAETTNIVLGHATAGMAGAGQAVTLTPPVVVQDARSFRRPREALVLQVKVDTDRGLLTLNFVGPASAFALEQLLPMAAEDLEN